MRAIERIVTGLGLATRAEATTTPEATLAAITPPARSAAPSTLDELTALEAVYRALFYLETLTIQLSVDVERTLNGKTAKIERPSLVEKPNVDLDGPIFYAGTTVSLAARGNAFWYKMRGTDDTVVNVDLLDPLTVHVEYDKRRRRKLFHTDVRRDPFTSRDVEHLSLLRLPGKLEGLGPIQAGQAGLTSQLQLRRYADGWFTDEKNGRTDALLTTDQRLTPAEATEAKTRWMETQRMGDGPAVMGAGLDYRTLSLKPSEAQWLESQSFGVAGVARLFGLPAKALLVAIDGTSDTYSNVEQEDQATLRTTLMRYLIEQELALTRMLPRTQRARFNVNALLRTDTKTRYEAHEIGLRSGFLTVPEVRAIENLDPETAPAPQPAPTPERTATHG